MRRLVLLSLPAAALAAVLPASAAPVDTGRIAVAGFSLPASGGDHLQVSLRAVSAPDGDLLRVDVTRCDDDGCTPPRSYEGRLPKGALAIDPEAATGRLEAVVGGLDLTVAWTPDAGAPAVVIGGLSGGGNSENSAFSTYNAEPARAVVTLPGGHCADEGAAVGDEVRASVGNGSNAAATPLSRLRLRAPGAPTCG